MAANLAIEMEKDFDVDPSEPVVDSIFTQFERVIVQSLVTSFGLDFIVRDQHGGDVDTIHNVRKIGQDEDMRWKSRANEDAFNRNPKYDPADYHRGANNNYNNTKRDARLAYRESGQTVTDAYTGAELGFLGKSKGADPNKNAELDHVIAAKKIHEDKGRILARLDGEKLADADENLAWTNKSLNASMGAVDIEEYIAAHPEMPESQKQNMRRAHERATRSYERKLATAYYTSGRFFGDAAVAAGRVGAQMGLRQAMGFVCAEIWFAAKAEFMRLESGFAASELFIALGNGVKKGVGNARAKYRDLLASFKDGALSGALSSLTTTLSNIFFTTAKNIVRIIRQTWVSIVEAIKILIFNPDGYGLGDRIKAACKVLATGASILMGTFVSEMIAKAPLGTIPVVGEVLQTFCGALVSGILTCSLLYILDRCEIVAKLVAFLNSMPSIEKITSFYREQAARFEEYAASLYAIDIDAFRKEARLYTDICASLDGLSNEALNARLLDIYREHGFTLAYSGDFDDFMADKNNTLNFC